MIAEIPERLDEHLPLLLVAGHGDLPLGFRKSLEMIAGETRNMAYLCFEATDDPDAFGAEMARVLALAPQGCLVLLDLMGGTPFNQFCLNRAGANCRAVCGVNLAMLLEAASARGDVSLEELAAIAAEAGTFGIVDVMERLQKNAAKAEKKGRET